MKTRPGVFQLLAGLALLGVQVACAPPAKVTRPVLPGAEAANDSLSRGHSSTERIRTGAEADSAGAGWVPDHVVADSDTDTETLPEVAPETLEELFDYPVEVNRRVLHWIDEYKGRSRKTFEGSLRRSGRYLPYVRAVFEKEGVPPDLAFLAHVESGFRYDARSRAGAVGMWQFMAGTARELGLHCNRQVDERLDPEKSTRAAARYLRQLHDRYGDWHLALAAYNAGPGNVDRVIKKAGTKNFWEISRRGLLKNETRDFVPAILAATILFKSPGAYGLAEDTEKPVAYDVVEVDSPVDLTVLARCAGCDTRDLVRLNPALKAGRSPDVDRYGVRVPDGLGDMARARLEQVPASKRILVHTHKVKKGETLGGIAARYGTGVKDLQQANNLGRSTLIRVGQTLKLPADAGGAIVVASAKAEKSASSSGVTTGVTTSTQNSEAKSTARAARDAADGTAKDTANGPARGAFEHATDVESDGATQVVTELVHHRVRRGDTLFALANRYGTTVAALQQRNGIRNPRDLRVGQRLIVGETTTAVAAVETSVKSDPTTPGTNQDSTAFTSSDSVHAPEADTAPPLPAPSPEALGRVASTAHIVDQARAEIAQQPPEPAVSHRVRSGETLWSIARQHGVRVTDLRRWNGLRGNTIRPGQKLRLAP